jgi:hypothetical protein
MRAFLYETVEVYETVEAINVKKVTRLRSSLFYWSGTISIGVGVFLLSKEVLFGGFLILILGPFLLLYPPVRFLIGGKDSVGAVIATAVVEEVLKHKIAKALADKGKERRRR